MRIVINDIAAQNGGALSILKDFDSYIEKHDKYNKWIYLLSGSYVNRRKNVRTLCFPETKKNWWERIKFDLFKTSQLVNMLKTDVYISLQNVLPMGINARKILYVHQPIPFQTKKKFSFLKKEERIYAFYQYGVGLLIKNSIRRADTIIVQTEWMKQVVQKISRKNNVIKITPTVDVNDEGVSPYTFDKVHFFYPTSDAIYKNIKLIERACIILDEKNLNYSVDITVSKEKRDGLSKRINYIGRIDRNEVFRRYKSSVLIFPSYIETFGYPLLEARESGCYVLASDCNFSHELLDDYNSVTYFDPFSYDELATAMEDIITGKTKIRKQIEERTRTVQDTWEYLYSVILGSKGWNTD